KKPGTPSGAPRNPTTMRSSSIVSCTRMTVSSVCSGPSAAAAEWDVEIWAPTVQAPVIHGASARPSKRVSDAKSPSPAGLMEKIVHDLRGGGVQARRLFEVGQSRPRHRPDGSEGVEERALAGRADAGDLIERAPGKILLAPRPVRADREAVGLVAKALDEEQGGIAGRELERLAALNEEGLAAGVAVGTLGD